MTALRWHLWRAYIVIGLPGAVAIILLLAQLTHWVIVERPTHKRGEQLQRAVARLEVQVRNPAAVQPVAEAAPSVESFEARFPDERQATAVIARMQSLAARAGFTLEHADFRFEHASSDALVRYVIQLPVKAEYRAIRRFTRELLHEQSALALEEISVRRDDPKLSTVDAQIRFVLYLSRGRV